MKRNRVFQRGILRVIKLKDRRWRSFRFIDAAQDRGDSDKEQKDFLFDGTILSLPLARAH